VKRAEQLSLAPEVIDAHTQRRTSLQSRAA
jgi:hypothetical protein